MTTKVMSPAEMRAERVDALQQEIDTEVVNLTARLRASADFRAETRAKALVIEKVADLMRAAKCDKPSTCSRCDGSGRVK